MNSVGACAPNLDAADRAESGLGPDTGLTFGSTRKVLQLFHSSGDARKAELLSSIRACPPEADGAGLDSSHGAGRLSCVEVEKYKEALESSNLTDEQKKEFIVSLWSIMINLIDVSIKLNSGKYGK